VTYPGARRGGKDVHVGPFGEYKCDPPRMMAELHKGVEEIFKHTAMYPCVVYLNEVDVKAFIEFYIQPGVPVDLDRVAGGRILDTPFVTKDVKPGTAYFRQCPLMHASDADCVYAREAEKASIRSAVGASTTRLYSHPQHRVIRPTFIDRLVASGYSDEQVASWIRGQHGDLGR